MRLGWIGRMKGIVSHLKIVPPSAHNIRSYYIMWEYYVFAHLSICFLEYESVDTGT